MNTDLWNFALALYARPGVEATCLALQEEGANICLLLCAAWLDQRAVEYSHERRGQLSRTAWYWNEEVVVPLRQLRQQWRDEAQLDSALAALRTEVTRLELEAERELLTRLEAVSSGWPTGQKPSATGWLPILLPYTSTNDLSHHALRTLRTATEAMTQEAEDGL
ncbi:TIGR02444 family protein [Pseudomonas sp. R5(2019)]|uniref:TIGR02444 family protein n=1 Tax=Pseudomonas sp. R5(2019) TaxID=2697566 RepID=UPI001412F219|nr:TIGR02444 family protein [Pseudomonas sp. R5(2019)]NBA94347.1 TIGR02444 family protein [Pseudomonas sp. R5(2019)]